MNETTRGPRSVPSPPRAARSLRTRPVSRPPPAVKAKGRETKKLRVAVLCCDPASPLKSRGEEDFDYVHASESDAVFRRSLEAAGYEVSWHPAHLQNLEEIVDGLVCDVVFNLCDGSGPGRDNYPGSEAIEALERRGLPYTGSRLAPYRTSISKVAMKEVFRKASVPTAAWQLTTDPDEALLAELEGRPLIVKPNDAGGSAGVHLSSIVLAGEDALRRERVRAVVNEYGAALIEEYIDGREITVGLLGSAERARALPPLEVQFGPAFPKGRGIRTHETKWDPSSPLYGSFALACPAPMKPSLTRKVLQVARDAYRAIGGSGYGRVDLRVDDRGPFVLEVNMNCSLEYGEEMADCAMYPFAARAAGLDFPELLRRLIEDARRTARAARAKEDKR